MSTSIITLQPSGWTFAARDGETLLRAAERAGIELASSCRNGTCRACICRLAPDSRGAAVRYLVDWPGLSVDERRDGYLLPCVAVAQEDVAIEQHLARRMPAGA